MRTFETFIQKHGSENCYIGITDDFKRRFREHKVTGDGGKYTRKDCDAKYGDAGTENNARAIEKTFLIKYKANNIQGGKGGGQGDSKFVYIYKIVLRITDEEA